ARPGLPKETAQELAAALTVLEHDLAPIAPPAAPAAPADQALQVGDTVHITTFDQTGELLRLGDNQAEVRVGGFRLVTTPAVLAFRGRPQPPDPNAAPPPVRPRAESPGMELHLRGLRAEEVAPVLERYLQSAYLAELPWVHIIHGKGLGVLKQVVRDLLAINPLVASFRPGALNEGGDGMTVVKLHKLNE
ncbi:MAG: Smr/MutS family protein, partial [Chloroflexota bacterium]